MEKVLTITKEIAAKVLLFGACRAPKVGSRIDEQSQSDLIWAERMLPIKGIKIDVPLWTISVYGSGSGSGYGYGYGYGSGDGYGDGYGYGYGSG